MRSVKVYAERSSVDSLYSFLQVRRHSHSPTVPSVSLASGQSGRSQSRINVVATYKMLLARLTVSMHESPQNGSVLHLLKLTYAKFLLLTYMRISISDKLSHRMAKLEFPGKVHTSNFLSGLNRNLPGKSRGISPRLLVNLPGLTKLTVPPMPLNRSLCPFYPTTSFIYCWTSNDVVMIEYLSKISLYMYFKHFILVAPVDEVLILRSISGTLLASRMPK
ncbi:hypothetical protein B0H19DRAFT_1334135 [Mycena capillaripes]|nr:hypothetical protein B0H19DRAFT_1334135 [Mycena capillaripes]